MNYWKIAPGQKGFCWTEQRDHSCIAVGWSEIGNLKNKDVNQIKKDFKKEYGKHHKPRQLLKFYKEVKKDDKIIANSGGKIFGFGKVDGGYKFNDELIYKHSKHVNWQFTFWAPLGIEYLKLPERLEKSLRKQCTIKLLDEKDGKIVEKTISKIENTFKNKKDVEGLCFAPQTEQEVIILFSRISQQLLKMKIEYVSTPFPDAIIRVKKRKKWISKYAEFELMSSGFESHLKDLKDKECSFIICWEDDWEEKPKIIIDRKIKIIELRKELERIL